MAAKNSNLSSPRYGYNVVVATTQASINATMKTFLDSVEQPVFNICFVADPAGNPVRIDFDEVRKVCDPFTIPANALPASDPNLRKLLDMRFVAGIRARLGIPASITNPRKIPDLVVLGDDTASVTFNMLCAEFEIVELSPGGYGGMSWTHMSQSDGDPWILQSKVDLRLSTVDRNRYSTLPPDVQRQIKNLSDAFSIRQLMFNLLDRELSAPPTIQGIQAGSRLYTLLQQYFVGAYFSQVRTKGEPVLNVTITRNQTSTSSLAITDLNHQVCAFVGSGGATIINPTPEQARLSTLSYLCETNNGVLPPAVPFTWNWVEPGQQRDFDGVVAINRKTFAQFLRNQMANYVSSNCYAPSVTITMDGLTSLWYRSLTPGQQPTVTLPESGSTVLTFSYMGETFDQAGLNGAVGQCRIKSGFTLNVRFEGGKVLIDQHLTVWVRARSLATEKEGNVVNRTISDEITLSVGADGRLQVGTPVSTTTNKPDDLHVDGFLNFWTQLNNVTDFIKNYAYDITAQRLTSLPIGLVQDFVFPGGRTFAFKDVAFSEYQDLVAHITYTTQK
jgi:hypothetical protein